MGAKSGVGARCGIAAGAELIMRPLRIYVDTSVFGGALDEEFQEHSLRFFQLAAQPVVRVLVSDVVVAELARAPEGVRDVLMRIPASAIEVIGITSEVLALRDAYLQAGVLTPRWIDDATTWRRRQLREPTQLSRGISSTSFGWTRSKPIMR